MTLNSNGFFLKFFKLKIITNNTPINFMSSNSGIEKKHAQHIYRFYYKSYKYKKNLLYLPFMKCNLVENAR